MRRGELTVPLHSQVNRVCHTAAQLSMLLADGDSRCLQEPPCGNCHQYNQDQFKILAKKCQYTINSNGTVKNPHACNSCRRYGWKCVL